jgi:hypothetical protein
VDAGFYNRRLGPAESSGNDAGGASPEPASSPEKDPDATSEKGVENSEAETGSAADEEAPPYSGLLPARLGEVAGNPDSPVGILFSLDHPFFRILRNVGDLLTMVHFYNYFTLHPFPASQVLARFGDADTSPAIVEHAVELGRVILFASTLDMEWNDWPRNPTYLLVLHELVKTVVQSRTQRAQPLAGVPVEIPVDIALYSQEARLRVPGYPSRPERSLAASPAPNQGEAGDLQFRFLIKDTQHAGLYALKLESKSGEEEWRQIAVRRDPRESDLTRVTAAKLRELYPEVEITVLRDAASFSQVGRGGFEVSDVLLWAFIALLFLEVLLARIFAHHPSARSASASAGGVT